MPMTLMQYHYKKLHITLKDVVIKIIGFLALITEKKPNSQIIKVDGYFYFSFVGWWM